MRWEVTSFLSDLGSFVETARVQPLSGELAGQAWVQRLTPGLNPVHRARVLRRWYLASRLTSSAWPRLLDAGDDESRPWVVVEASGFRLDGTLPFVDPQQGLREVRKLAMALAEAEALLEGRYTRPALALRPNVVSRTPEGGLVLHLAALDQEPDEGFPYQKELALFTPEELQGHPATARTNAFCLGWLLCLALTGRWPYSVEVAPDAPLDRVREALRWHVLTGRVRALGLPEELRPAEALLRRALAPQPGARPPSAAAFAEALQALAPGLPAGRGAAEVPALAEPPWDAGDELLPADLEASLASRGDEPQAWQALAERLDLALGGRSDRAALIRAQPLPGAPPPSDARLLPALAGEQLEASWQRGYVRVLAATPTQARPDAEAHVAAVVGLLQHPSLRFVREVRLKGPEAHARAWVEALQRQPLPSLRQVGIDELAETDPWALDLAYRLPRWTWSFGNRRARGLAGMLKRLLGS